MVAAERLSRAQAETRMKAAEENLAAAEAAMRDMQAHLQSLPALLPAPTMAAGVSASGLGESSGSGGSRNRRKYLAAHTPFAEFASFLYHIRMLKPQHTSYATSATLPPPQISSLLTQPLLARAVTEDCDPTLRLDVAPDLSYFSRRNVASAIIAGDLIIEPVGLATLIASSNAYAGASGDIGCSLCGRSIFDPKHRPGPSSSTSAQHAQRHGSGSAASSTSPAARPNSTSRFSLMPFFNSPTTASSPSAGASGSPSASPGASPMLNGHQHLPPIFIFRVSPTSSTNANTPEKEREVQGRLYPLCASGWCLTRLRAVCEWWRYVRLGLVEAIWKGEDGWVHPTSTSLSHPAPRGVLVKRTSQPPTPQREPTPLPTSMTNATPTSPPALPPRRSGWGLGFKSLGGGSSTSSGASSRGLGFGKTPPQSPTAELAERDIEPIVKVDLAELTNGEVATASKSTDTLDKPEDRGQEASSSAEGSETDGASSFQTPEPSQNGESPKERRSLEVPDEDGPEGKRREETSLAPKEGSVELASPRPSAESSRPANLEAPTPRRPARRAAPIAPSRQSLDQPTVVLDDDDKVAPEADVEPKTPDMNGPQVVATPSPAAAPPIPPRHARQDSLNDTPTPAAADKTAWKYLAGEDSWDNKAWREIIRLKEEMWQARVGVHELEE